MAKQTLLQVLLAAQPDNPNRIHHKPISGQLNLLGLQSHPIEPQSPSTPFVDRPKPNPRENKWKKKEERRRVEYGRWSHKWTLRWAHLLPSTSPTSHYIFIWRSSSSSPPSCSSILHCSRSLCHVPKIMQDPNMLLRVWESRRSKNSLQLQMWLQFRVDRSLPWDYDWWSIIVIKRGNINSYNPCRW